MISIIIPTKNSGDIIERCLKSILNLKNIDFEVLIVDGKSRDNTVKICEKFGCRILYEDGGTRAAAVNVGVDNSTGEYTAFTDADAVVDPYWLSDLVKPFKDRTVAAVMGRQLIPDDAPFFAKCVMKGWQTILGGGTLHGLKPGSDVTWVDHPIGVNSIVRRKAFSEVGHLSEELVTAEDVELGFRLRQRGYRIAYSSDAKVWHYRIGNHTPFEHLKHMVKYGYGRAQLFKKNMKTMHFVNFAPSLMVILIFLVIPLGLFNPLLYLIGLSYFILVLMAGIFTGKGVKEKIGIAYSLVIAHFGYGCGFIKGLLKR